MVRYPLLIVNVVALLFTACSSNVCSPATCLGGCCNGLGVCVSPTAEACGKPGETCAMCAAGQQCLAGVCSGGGAGGSGTAGGSGMAGGSGTGGGGGSGGSAGGFADDAGMPRCAATTVLCQDESVMELPLYMTVNPDGVVEEGTAPNFVSRIDARARATGSFPNDSFLYFSFGPNGLVKKSISDEQAFTSLDWDFALRRYVLRLNSGVSGPSCVEGARTAPGTSFDTLTQVPDGLSWRTEEYFTPPAPPATACTVVAHPSGLGVGTALSSYWTYQMCVQTTPNVYIVRTREGRYVKLHVLSYYSPTEQMTCNSTGSVPTPNQAAIVRIRWGFIAPPH